MGESKDLIGGDHSVLDHFCLFCWSRGDSDGPVFIVVLVATFGVVSSTPHYIVLLLYPHEGDELVRLPSGKEHNLFFTRTPIPESMYLECPPLAFALAPWQISFCNYY